MALPKPVTDYVQLNDLGDGINIGDIMTRVEKEASESCDVYEDKDSDGEYYPRDEDYNLEFEIDESLGWTYLHFAAFNGHTECVRLLLDEGIGKMAFHFQLLIFVANRCSTGSCERLSSKCLGQQKSKWT